ncbi:MAG: hypothetical protein CBC42_06605 [Betaproteobacteria bacterium TMED82]|nr:MAG: hypothetical protein CBC42_06605 [Betaproteobacteria bacterium TMED82]|tara:strand:- start:11010 stop:12389 length:1380 start_codon:yes stop_codon:yes gene_type:complete
MIWIACLVTNKNIKDIFSYSQTNNQESKKPSEINKQIIKLSLGITPKVYKSKVSQMILLEVSTVLKLRKGLSNILKFLNQEIIEIINKHSITNHKQQRDKYYFKIGVSLTPYASEWICLESPRNSKTVILSKAEMFKRIKKTRMQSILEAHSSLETLFQLGIKTISQMMILPKKGAMLRFGKDLIRAVDRSFDLDDNKHKYHTNLIFYEEEFPLNDQVNTLKSFISTINYSLNKILLWMKQNYYEIQTIKIDLISTKKPGESQEKNQTISIDLSEPTQSANKFLSIFINKINYTAILHPIEKIVFMIPRIEILRVKSNDFFTPTNGSKKSLNELFDIIESRIGEEKIYCYSMRDDYAPELKMVQTPVTSNTSQEKLLIPNEHQNLTWLLESPLKLEVKNNIPLYEGILIFQGGPERIEANWWTKNPIRRDYFIAETKEKKRIWVFRTPDKSWYLQGIFG